VGCVANGRGESPQASEDCVISCVRRLQEIMESGTIVLDEDHWILSEYRDNLRSDGQPGVGDAFLKWVYNYQWNPQRCDRVRITPLADGTGFAEFPRDPDLTGFDPSDRVYVAAACAHPGHPPILNAVDTDWWIFRDILQRNGVALQFLCESDVRQMAERRR
jgi:hypothetical protein